jgi:hypothetical protein
LSCSLWIFVLPHAHHDPTSFAQHLVGLRIAGSIPSDLFLPERRTLLGGSMVFRTPVPVTTIDEDGDTGFRKHDVSGSA